MSDPTPDLAFDPTLISRRSLETLPLGYTLRPLAADDHTRGYFDLLSVLTVAPALSAANYQQIFASQKACPNTYHTIVIVQAATDTVVACGSLIIERKYTRGGGLVGHIEDIAVSKAMQGKKFGLKIIEVLGEIGQAQGCYKIILDCSKDNIPFYEKCGYKHKEFQMVRYMSDPVGIPVSPSNSKL